MVRVAEWQQGKSDKMVPQQFFFSWSAEASISSSYKTIETLFGVWIGTKMHTVLCVNICKKITSLQMCVRTMWWYQSSKTAKIIWVTLDGAMHMASLQVDFSW